MVGIEFTPECFYAVDKKWQQKAYKITKILQSINDEYCDDTSTHLSCLDFHSIWPRCTSCFI